MEEIPITSQELKSLCCPIVKIQQNNWNAILEPLNKDENKFKSLVESLGYEFVESNLFKSSKDDKFHYNPIYVLTVKENELKCKLILKIAEPHPFLETKKVTHEVAVINFLKEKTKIPVPTILSYSNDKKKSKLGCEYILMNKMKGKFLRELFESADQIPNDLRTQLLDFYRELKSIHMDQQHKIGCFDEKLKIVPKFTNTNTTYITQSDYLGFFLTEIEWNLKEMSKIKRLQKFVQKTTEFTQELVKICENNKLLNKLNFQDEMSLFNSEINGWNILIDKETLTINQFCDWESSFYGFDNKELEFLNDIFDGKEKYKLFNELNIETLGWYNQSVSKKIRKFLEEILTATNMLAFYSSNWFLVHECTVQNHLKYWSGRLNEKLVFSDFFLDSLKEYKVGDKSFDYFLVTPEEDELLENSTYEKQLEAVKNISKMLNEERIRNLIESLDLTFKSFEALNHDNGIVNVIFLIKAEKNQLQIELVLKLGDPHPFFAGKKTANEVGVINYLKENTTIPVPTIRSYSVNKETSHLGCEYILMDKVKGRILRELIQEKFQDVNNLPEKLIDQMINICRELKTVKFSGEKIGSFDLNMNIIPLTQNGPNIEQCDNYLELIDKQLHWEIKEMNKIQVYTKLANRLESFRTNLNQIVEDNEDLDNLNFNDEMSLVHGDLHAGNIFVDQDTYEITAIIDWEWAYYGIDDMQVDWISTWYFSSESRQILKDKIKSKSFDWFKETRGKKFRKFLANERYFRWTVFFLVSILVNIGFTETQWNEYSFARSVDTIEKSLEFFESLRAYKKK